MSSRKSFVMYTSMYGPIQHMGDADLGKLLKAIFEYQINGTDPATDSSIYIPFQFFRAQFDEDERKYQLRCKKNQDNARLRWDAIASDGMRTDAKDADNDNDNDNDINIVVDKNAKKPKRFNKPTANDVREYMAELKMDDMSQRFVDYYKSNGWRVGKNPMKDWKAAVRTWNKQNKPKQQTESPYKQLNFD